LSAGLDSQIVCLALKEIKKDFEAVTMAWLDNDGNIINADDVNYAIEFCKLHNIKHTCVKYSVEAFLAGRGTYLAQKYCIHFYRKIVQAHLLDLYKDTHTILIGAGNPVFDMVGGKLMIEISATYLQRCYVNEGVEGTSIFFKYTPELYMSQIDNVFCDAFLAGAYKSMFDAFKEDSKNPYWTWRMFTSYFKPLVCQANWDGLLHRSKQHGFETYSKDDYWKKQIELQRAGRKNILYADAFEFTEFLKQPKGTQRLWTI
jgi:hypothetical protein